MIDPEKERLLSMGQTAKRLPRRRAGKRASPSTPYRWTTIGCRGEYLEFVQIGAKRFTSVEALQRFFARLTARARGSSGVEIKKPRAQSTQIVDRQLEEEGL